MDETTTDVVPTEGGGQATPTPDTSSQDAGQGSSSEESSSEAVLTRLAEVEGMLRRFQSDEDRGLHRVEQEVKALPTQFETYYKRRESGLSHEQAIREDVLDEIVAGRSGSQSDALVPPATEPAAQATVAVDEGLSAILKFTGLDSGEADVVAIIKANPNNELAQISAVTKLAESRKNAQTTPGSAAAVLPSGGGGAVVSDDMDSLSERLTELVNLPSQTPESEAEREEIVAKINKLSPIQ